MFSTGSYDQDGHAVCLVFRHTHFPYPFLPLQHQIVVTHSFKITTAVMLKIGRVADVTIPQQLLWYLTFLPTSVRDGFSDCHAPTTSYAAEFSILEQDGICFVNLIWLA